MPTEPAHGPLSGASYLIPVDNVAPLIRHAARLLERARKAGVDCRLEWRIEPQPQVLRDGDLHQWITITSAPPRLAGWSLAARYDVDPLGMTATIPHAVPGVELPARYWILDAPVCEHCNTERDRRAVFLLAHDDGRHILVGRSCLKAFLRHPDADRIATLFDTLVPDAVAGGYLVRDPSAAGYDGGYLDGVEELAWTAAIVARYGWRSVAKSDAEHTATASRLAFLTNRPNPKLASLWHAERIACAPADDHYAAARNTVELVQAARPDREYLAQAPGHRRGARRARARPRAVVQRHHAAHPLEGRAAPARGRRRRAADRDRPPGGRGPRRQTRHQDLPQLLPRGHDRPGRARQKVLGDAAALPLRVERGRRGRVCAHVEPSADNPAFAFFKRPTRVPKAA